ncbi:hypothetical protein CYMTET_8044 [Cymbomonas tetramitiformis]|uniref:Uncharacterized protein n=1 Tax=Cymbomonas tetramitiformis TaxID=36881 RepID=A0AAE0LGV7_9CHLO|nr:hypothetical protein CYMTET_8044 [Cymbomonas tetramitiformis]
MQEYEYLRIRALSDFIEREPLLGEDLKEPLMQQECTTLPPAQQSMSYNEASEDAAVLDQLSDVDEDINPLLPNRSFGDIEASTFLSRTDIEFSETTDTEIPSPRVRSNRTMAVGEWMTA